MRMTRAVVVGLLCMVAAASAQTAEELVAKNLQARGGVDKIKAVNTLKMTGKAYFGINVETSQEQKRPNMLRQNFTVQGMTQIQSYDGSVGWQISPFQGRRDPELLGEDDMRDLVEDSDIDGPLVDYQAKGNKVEYLGHDQVDGDDVYKLKVTLKNGDIVYYFLDPDTYLEIKTERQQFIRGSVRDNEVLLGSYKQVGGVYYPFSIEAGQKGGGDKARYTFDTIEVNVPIEDSYFKMPAAKK
jgi:outer membrane lipoprotein-sorting protein